MNKLLLLVALLLTLAIASCKKDQSSSPEPDPTSQVIVNDNVIVVDSTRFSLTSSPDQLGQGIYIFNGNGADSSQFKVGSIIVGTTGEGYLRKVTTVSQSGSTITLNTEQGTLEDVFQQGRFTVSSGLDGLHKGTGFEYEIGLTDEMLYSGSAGMVKVNEGAFKLSADLDITPTIQDGSLQQLSAKFTGKVDAGVELKVDLSGSGEFAKRDTLAKRRKYLITLVEFVPVVVVTDLYVISDISGTYSGNISTKIGVDASCTYEAGAVYTKGSGWQPTQSFTPTCSYHQYTQGGAKLTVNSRIIPEISTRLYGVAGPYLAPAAHQNIQANIVYPDLDWDLAQTVNLEYTLGISGSIFGHNLGDYNKTWTLPRFAEYYAPASLAIVSGNNQTGAANQALQDSLVVKVTDNIGLPTPLVPVRFTVMSDGSVSSYRVFTDINGLAKVRWTLGLEIYNAQVVAAVLKGDGQQIGQPVTFTANSKAYEIGDTAFGGIIFWLDSASVYPNQHGMVCALEDQGVQVRFSDVPSNWSVVPGVGWSTPSDGSAATDTLISYLSTSGNCAATCRNYRGGGFSDWFLPNPEDLLHMYDNMDKIGIPSSAVYWTSFAWQSIISGGVMGTTIHFDNGWQMGGWNQCCYYYNLRAVRRF